MNLLRSIELSHLYDTIAVDHKMSVERLALCDAAQLAQACQLAFGHAIDIVKAAIRVRDGAAGTQRVVPSAQGAAALRREPLSGCV